ncbi:nucleotidyltransferase family protein [Magnetococcales bacterium HHB-1]
MKAMILAAGKGTRLGPLTQSTPKPLVQINGVPVIEHTLQRLADAGFKEVVINAWHLAEKLMHTVGDGHTWGLSVKWSKERRLLETGGGVCNALPLLGNEPFLVINGDILWDFDLEPFLDAYDPNRFDAFLGLIHRQDDHGGDFLLQRDGSLKRAIGADHSLIYCGVQILHPQALKEYTIEPFSLNVIYDDCQKQGRLGGYHLWGHWADMGTPARLQQAEQRLWLAA